MTEQETRDMFAAHALAALIYRGVGDPTRYTARDVDHTTIYHA
jgi:hypothetical protein